MAWPVKHPAAKAGSSRPERSSKEEEGANGGWFSGLWGGRSKADEASPEPDARQDVVGQRPKTKDYHPKKRGEWVEVVTDSKQQQPPHDAGGGETEEATISPMDAALKYNAALNRKNDSLIKKLAKLDASVKAKDQEIARLKKSLQSAAAESGHLSQASDVSPSLMSKKVMELEVKLQASEKENQKLHHEFQQIQTSTSCLGSLSSENTDLRAKVNELENERDTALSELESEKLQALTFKSDWEEERKDRERAHSIIGELESRLSQQSSHTATVALDLENLEVVKAQYQKRLRENMAIANTEIKRLRDDLSGKNSQVKQYVKQNGELKEQLEQAFKNITKLSEEMDKLRKKVKKLPRHDKKSKSDLSNVESDLSAEVESLHSENEELLEQIAALRAFNQSLKEMLQETGRKQPTSSIETQTPVTVSYPQDHQLNMHKVPSMLPYSQSLHSENEELLEEIAALRAFNQSLKEMLQETGRKQPTSSIETQTPVLSPQDHQSNMQKVPSMDQWPARSSQDEEIRQHLQLQFQQPSHLAHPIEEPPAAGMFDAEKMLEIIKREKESENELEVHLTEGIAAFKKKQNERQRNMMLLIEANQNQFSELKSTLKNECDTLSKQLIAVRRQHDELQQTKSTEAGELQGKIDELAMEVSKKGKEVEQLGSRIQDLNEDAKHWKEEASSCQQKYEQEQRDREVEKEKLEFFQKEFDAVVVDLRSQLDQLKARVSTKPAESENAELARYRIMSYQPLRGDSFSAAGSYGSVHRVQVNNIPCIAKKIHDILIGKEKEEAVSKDQKQAIKLRFHRECVLLSRMRHPNIVQFMGVCYPNQDPLDLTLIMEFLPMDLEKCLQKYPNLPLPIKLSILYDVSYGLLHLHNASIIHRDLSAANVLLTPDMRAKITDFGVSKILEVHPIRMSKQSTLPGALGYMPPEALWETPQYGTKLDIFSFGVVVLFVAVQQYPQFYEIAGQETVDIHIKKRQKWIRMLPGKDCRCLHDLIIQCLQDKAAQRPTAERLNLTLKQLSQDHPRELTDIVHLEQELAKQNQEVSSLVQEGEHLKKQLADAEVQRIPPAIVFPTDPAHSPQPPYPVRYQQLPSAYGTAGGAQYQGNPPSLTKSTSVPGIHQMQYATPQQGPYYSNLPRAQHQAGYPKGRWMDPPIREDPDLSCDACGMKFAVGEEEALAEHVKTCDIYQ